MLIEETGADSVYWNRRYDLAPRYYKVFTPYWRAAQDSIDTAEPLPAPPLVKFRPKKSAMPVKMI